MQRLTFWAGLVGFGIAALFDGILLHRILQWHHVSGHVLHAPRGILWDGILDAHALATLLVGLWGLWVRRGRLMLISGRCIAGLVLIGFGLWHIAEGMLVHVALGLHHIRPQAEFPLLWDLLWLVAFGLLPLVAGLALRDAPER